MEIIVLENNLAGGRVIQNPNVSHVPQVKINDNGTTKHLQELLLPCAFTYP